MHIVIHMSGQMVARARWRCSLCHMRRELVAASGVWYHGGLAQPVISSTTFRQKLSSDSSTMPRSAAGTCRRMRLGSDEDYLINPVDTFSDEHCLDPGTLLIHRRSDTDLGGDRSRSRFDNRDGLTLKSGLTTAPSVSLNKSDSELHQHREFSTNCANMNFPCYQSASTQMYSNANSSSLVASTVQPSPAASQNYQAIAHQYFRGQLPCRQTFSTPCDGVPVTTGRRRPPCRRRTTSGLQPDTEDSHENDGTRDVIAANQKASTVLGVAGVEAPDASGATGNASVCGYDDDELDTEERFLLERARCRQERIQFQQKKNKKRGPRRASVGTCTVEDDVEYFSAVDVERRTQCPSPTDGKNCPVGVFNGSKTNHPHYGVEQSVSRDFMTHYSSDARHQSRVTGRQRARETTSRDLSNKETRPMRAHSATSARVHHPHSTPQDGGAHDQVQHQQQRRQSSGHREKHGYQYLTIVNQRGHRNRSSNSCERQTRRQIDECRAAAVIESRDHRSDVIDVNSTHQTAGRQTDHHHHHMGHGPRKVYVLREVDMNSMNTTESDVKLQDFHDCPIINHGANQRRCSSADNKLRHQRSAGQLIPNIPVAAVVGSRPEVTGKQLTSKSGQAAGSGSCRNVVVDDVTNDEHELETFMQGIRMARQHQQQRGRRRSEATILGLQQQRHGEAMYDMEVLRRLSGDDGSRLNRTSQCAVIVPPFPTGSRLPIEIGVCGSDAVQQSSLAAVPAGVCQLPPPPSPRKLSGSSIASYGSFASSYQDYCRKLSNSSAASAAVEDQLSPPPRVSLDHSQTSFLDQSAHAGPLSNSHSSKTGRKFSDPQEYRRFINSRVGVQATSSRALEAEKDETDQYNKLKTPMMFEVDHSGEIRRLTGSSLARYRPYLSRSGDIIMRQRSSLSEERRRSSTAADECQRRHLMAASSFTGSDDKSPMRQLSSKSSLSEQFGSRDSGSMSKHSGNSMPSTIMTSQDAGNCTSTAPPPVRRKMSESVVLELIKEQSTSRDDSEHSSSLRGTTKSHRSHSGHQFRVVLSRDPRDQCCRMGGLGMRVVGGKQGPDQKLGTYVASVVKAGPADMAGIVQGDQVLEWDGCSLQDATFEEARDIMSRSGDTVQLVLMHCRGSICGRIRSIESVESYSSKTENVTSARKASATDGSTHDMHVPKSSLFDENESDFIYAHPRKGQSHHHLELTKRTSQSRLDPNSQAVPPNTSAQNFAAESTTQLLLGNLCLQLMYNSTSAILTVTVLCGDDFPCHGSPGRTSLDDQPSLFVKLAVLPKHSVKETGFRTKVAISTSRPKWNESFTFTSISVEKLPKLTLLLTVWNDGGELEPDTFVGEVLLDLATADVYGSSTWYPLTEHDFNCSSVPAPSPKCARSSLGGAGGNVNDINKRNGVESTSISRQQSKDSSGGKATPDPLESEPGRSSPSISSQVNSSTTHKKGRRVRRLQDFKRRVTEMAMRVNAAIQDKWDTNSAPDIDDVRCSPAITPSSERDLCLTGQMQTSNDSAATTSKSKANHRRRASHSVPNRSSGATTEDSKDIERPVGSYEDMTSFLGPGQILSSASADGVNLSQQLQKATAAIAGGMEKAAMTSASVKSCGDIKLAFVITKGQLELDVICAKGLTSTQLQQLKPDTYVKTCLTDGTKRLQKKRTKTVRGSVDPFYITKLKYPASNVCGRQLQVLVKERVGNLDRSRCIGEVLISFDGLDLTKYIMGWYRLFDQSQTKATTTFSADSTVGN